MNIQILKFIKFLLTPLIIIYYSASSNAKLYIDDSKINFTYNQASSRE